MQGTGHKSSPGRSCADLAATDPISRASTTTGVIQPRTKQEGRALPMGLVGSKTTVKSINDDASPYIEATNAGVDDAWTQARKDDPVCGQQQQQQQQQQHLCRKGLGTNRLWDYAPPVSSASPCRLLSTCALPPPILFPVVFPTCRVGHFVCSPRINSGDVGQALFNTNRSRRNAPGL